MWCGRGGRRATTHTKNHIARHTHTTRLCPAPQQPKTRVFNRLPAASGHTTGSTANSPPAATAGARAGRAPLADREPRLSPTQPPPPSTSTTQPSAQGPYRLGRAQKHAEKLLQSHRVRPSCPGSAAEIRNPAKTSEERLRARIPAGSRGLCPRPLYLRHAHGQTRLVESNRRYLGPCGCAPAQPPKSARIVATERAGRRRGLNRTGRKRQADRPRSGSAAARGVGIKGEQEAGCTEGAKRCRTSQHVERRTPGELAESAKSEPLEPRCVGTAQLTSETCAASKPVPEGNVWHQQLASAAPGSC